MRVFAPTILLLLLPGCFRITWTREMRQEPLDPWAIVAIENERPDLGPCLERLGAPWDVFPNGVDETGLIYAWYDDDSVGVNLSYSFERAVSASFSYTDTNLDIPALLLLFDADEHLTLVRRGRLSDLINRRRLDVQVVD